MIKVVADTNIYISALNFAGIPDEILSLARKGEIELFISPPILQEIEEVLLGKFEWAAARFKKAVVDIEKFTHLVQPMENLLIIKEDEDDNRILECAQAAQAQFIVSGDNHLRKLKTFQEIKIVSPIEFLGLWENQFETDEK
ncbi:MAG: putative toxin-antitoxin system toxin component, PIN family [Candidatus Schekmanbacteria bacterium]|nr:putative toxin-antitoxin system toxin component, PIN family [Candidatus Schekmanbacteria bacterium]